MHADAISSTSTNPRIHKTAGLLLAGALLLNGCTILTPRTPGELARDSRDYGYKPLDPLPIKLTPKEAKPKAVLSALPDETMRLAIGLSSIGAGITYGPANIGYAGSNYMVILDYVKYTTMPLGLTRNTEVTPMQTNVLAQVEAKGLLGTQLSSRHIKILPARTNVSYKLCAGGQAPDVILPVYVGVGVRLQASLSVLQGSVNLGSLAAIGAAAQAGRVSGTLVVQSLGISGQGVSSAMTIASDINPTTIQNALVAMGTIKSKVYDAQDDSASILVVPRALAVYDSIGGGPETINGIISFLLENPLELDTTTGLVSQLKK